MDVDWERYQDSYPYRACVSLHYLERQSESLKQRAFRATGRSLARNVAFLALVFGTLWLLSASGGTYGIAMVGVGAIILAWTAFRVHEKAFREAALVPDDRKGDTPYQERVSMTAMNYADAASGVLLVASGFVVRVVISLE